MSNTEHRLFGTNLTVRTDSFGVSELTLSSVAELAKVSKLTLSGPIQQELVAGARFVLSRPYPNVFA